MSINILIAEDEPRIARDLERRLQKLWPEIETVTIVHDGMEALKSIENNPPDIAFLDIRMPKMSGIEVALHIQNKCHIVFATAYDQHAVEAFDLGVIDYIVKPVNDERLATAITRLKEKLTHAPENSGNALITTNPPSYLKFIKANSGVNMHLIPMNEIIMFRKDGRYTQVITNTRSPLIKLTLKELDTMLDPDVFWRVRSAAIININALEKIIAQGRDGIQLYLTGMETPINVSRSYAYKFSKTDKFPR